MLPTLIPESLRRWPRGDKITGVPFTLTISFCWGDGGLGHAIRGEDETWQLIDDSEESLGDIVRLRVWIGLVYSKRNHSGVVDSPLTLLPIRTVISVGGTKALFIGSNAGLYLGFGLIDPHCKEDMSDSSSAWFARFNRGRRS